MQFNKFSLFYGSDIYRSPAAFGVELLEEAIADNDLKTVFSYRDAFGRSDATLPDMEYFAASMDMDKRQMEKAEETLGFDYIHALFLINYASFGLIHKDKVNENLFHRLI